jgi:hypothetical protein
VVISSESRAAAKAEESTGHRAGPTDEELDASDDAILNVVAKRKRAARMPYSSIRRLLGKGIRVDGEQSGPNPHQNKTFSFARHCVWALALISPPPPPHAFLHPGLCIPEWLPSLIQPFPANRGRTELKR